MLLNERRSLKLNLSRDDEPFQRGPGMGHRDFSLEGLLRSYFGFLRRMIIEPGLINGAEIKPENPTDVEKRGGAEHVQYVLTLPLLDGENGPLYCRQRERTVRCFAQAMGVLEQNITVIPEPLAAAYYYLIGPGQKWLSQELSASESPFRVGDRLFVLDSGGGTTDLIYGEIEDASLPPTLRLMASAGLGKDEEGKDRTFGGVDVSEILHKEMNKIERKDFFHRPCVHFPNEKESRADADRRGRPVLCWGDGKDDAPALVEKYKRELSTSYVPHESKTPYATRQNDEQAVKKLADTQIDLLAARLLDAIKPAAPAEPVPAAEIFPETEASPQDEADAEAMPAASEPAAIEPEPTQEAVAELAQEARRSSVLLVGGNTALPQVIAACQTVFQNELFNAKVLYEDDLNSRMHAVALGAVFAVDAYQDALVSRRLRVLLHVGNESLEMMNLSPHRMASTMNETRTVNGACRLEVWAGDAGSDSDDAVYCLYRRPFDAGKINVVLQGKRVKVSYGGHDGGVAPIWEGSI